MRRELYSRSLLGALRWVSPLGTGHKMRDAHFAKWAMRSSFAVVHEHAVGFVFRLEPHRASHCCIAAIPTFVWCDQCRAVMSRALALHYGSLSRPCCVHTCRRVAAVEYDIKMTHQRRAMEYDIMYSEHSMFLRIRGE